MSYTRREKLELTAQSLEDLKDFPDAGIKKMLIKAVDEDLKKLLEQEKCARVR